MNSREIVRRTLDFDNPERVARWFDDWDFVWTRQTAKTRATPWREVGDGRWEMTDAFGNTWARIDATTKGEVSKGVLENLGDLDRYDFPDFSKPEDYDATRRARAGHPDKWVIGGLSGFTFSIARYMRRLEQYFMDLLLERERIHELHDRVDAAIETQIANYADAGADCVMFGEDWGTQDRLLISPALWREEFRPRFEKLCSAAHSRGLRVFMHSCGQIEAIVPDLIDAGIDLFEFHQPRLHGFDVLAKHQERAKVTFECPVDIQTTLQTRDERLIRAEARELLDKLWKGRGGFVAGYYEDNVSIGLPPEAQQWACDEFVKHGVAENYQRP